MGRVVRGSEGQVGKDGAGNQFSHPVFAHTATAPPRIADRCRHDGLRRQRPRADAMGARDRIAHGLGGSHFNAMHVSGPGCITGSTVGSLHRHLFALHLPELRHRLLCALFTSSSSSLRI
nr:hypothetical protein CFP56_09610 [Quercus suber]